MSNLYNGCVIAYSNILVDSNTEKLRMTGLKLHGIQVLFTLVISVVVLDQSLVFVSGWTAGKVTVHLANELSATEESFTVHCRSGDDDLGSHEIIWKSSYEFSFRNKLGDTTLFNCQFEWLNTISSDSVLIII